MRIMIWISNMLIPLVLFYILGHGLISGVKVYEVFLKGAEEGLKVVIGMAPTLIGLLIAVGVLRECGFMDLFKVVFRPLAEFFKIPEEIFTLLGFKLFSGSAATGLVLDIFRTYGPDSYVGIMASILVSCTETCFYTMSVYFLAVNVTKTRYTLPGALLAIGAGAVATVLISRLYCK